MQAAAREWSEYHFGGAALGDIRRTRRLVAMAGAMVEHPNVLIPAQMRSWADTKAAYRLLDNAAVSYEQLQQTHWQRSRERAEQGKTTLLIQDTTQVDLTGRMVSEAGQLGDGRGQGVLLHTTLGVEASSGRVLGIMHQQVYRRQATHSRQERSQQRLTRATEARFWSESVRAVGMAPARGHWVYLADRGGDVFELYGTCRQYQSDFLVRIAQDRRMFDKAGQAHHLIRYLRQLSPLHHMTVSVTDPTKTPRHATVNVAFSPVTLRPPVYSRPDAPAAQWLYALRVWEPTPPENVDPIEWLLVTSLPVNDPAQAETYIGWYAMRPLIEDYHQCLKTGCRLEQRQLHSADRFERLLAILGVVAVRLLQLRTLARTASATSLDNSLAADEVTLIAAVLHCSPAQLTAQQAWLWIAQQGGYLNRRHDPPPGWQASWRGWQYLQTLIEGRRLVHPPQ